MRYTLITGKGSVMRFYILAMAELYQKLYGGVVLSADVLSEVECVEYQKCYV
jgi:hypothetical protein